MYITISLIILGLAFVLIGIVKKVMITTISRV